MANYIQFGSGLLYFNPNAGNLATNPTPAKGLTIQDVEIDLGGDIKELRGQYKFPDDTAAADAKSTFKFGIGRQDFFLLSNIFFADIVAAGGNTVAPNEVHAIGATIAVVPPGSGAFGEDLGVSFQATGKELTKVPTSPAAGQYSVASGTYTFNATDVSAAGNVLISYMYSLTAIGATYQVNQQVQGYGPQFEMFIVDNYQLVNGIIPSCVRLYAAKVAKVSKKNKRADYSMIDIEGSYFASPSGRVVDFYSNAG